MVIPLSMSDELDAKVKQAATYTKLNQQETIRQALWLGLPALCDKWPKPHCQPAVRNATKAKYPARKDGAK